MVEIMGNEAIFDDAGPLGRMPPPPSVSGDDPAVPHEIRFDATPRDPPTIYSSPGDLEYLFEHSRDLMCVASLDGFFLKVNPAFQSTLGWTTRQLKSKPFMDFVHPSDREETIGAMEVLRHGRPVGTFENRYLCSNGGYRRLSWNAYPRQDGTLSAVARDVTSASLAAPREDIGEAIQKNLHKYFSSSDSRDAFIGVTETAERGATWLKWGVAFIVTIFGAGVAYSQWVADNATKGDLVNHINNDLAPVSEDVSSVKVSVDSLVKAEKKRAAREVESDAMDKRMHLLEAHRAEYQEAMAEYAAMKAAGKRATRPRKTPEHLALEGDLGIPSRD